MTLHGPRVEKIDTVHGHSLVRVSGRWEPQPPTEFALAIGSEHVFIALPPGAQLGDGIWHAAFAVPEEVADVPFKLLTDSGIPVDLPPIAPPAVSEPSVETPVSTDSDAAEDLADARAVAGQLRRRSELAENVLAELRAEVGKAWTEAGELRALLDARESAHEDSKERARTLREEVAELEQRLATRERTLTERRAELQEQCARLEAKLAERTESERSARAAIDAASDRQAQLQADAADALARFEEARRETADLRVILARTRNRAEAAEAEFSAERERQTELEAHFAELRERYGELELRCERLVAEGDQARAEADTLRGQLRELLDVTEAAQRELLALREDRARLDAELETVAARLADAVKDAHDARARVDAAHADLQAERERVTHLEAELEGAQGRYAEVEAARADLNEARAAIEAIEPELSAARERNAELEARAEELEAELATAGGRAAEVESLRAELTAARSLTETIEAELAVERERSAALAAESAAVAGHGEATRVEADELRDRLDHARQLTKAMQGELAGAREREAELEAKLASANEDSGDDADAVAQVQAELDAARAEVVDLQAQIKERDRRFEQTTMALAQSEQALRSELESLTRTDLGDERGNRLLGRTKVSARAYKDALAEHERLTERVHELEIQLAAAPPDELTKRLEQVDRLENELAERDRVEADLRQLLEARQEEIEVARLELTEARARLAGLATTAPSDTALTPQVDAEVAEEKRPAQPRPWTAADDELIQRIARAKQLAGSDS